MGAGLQLVYDGGKISGYNTTKHPSQITEITGNHILEALVDNVIPAVAGNFMYSSEFLRKNKLLFKEGIKHEDELWMFHVSICSKKCLLLPHITYNYYRSNPNSTMNNRQISNLENIEKIIEEILETNDILQLHNKIGEEKFSEYLDRFYYIILNDENLTKSSTEWKNFYKKLKKTYIQSKTSHVIKKFSLPSSLAYILLLEKSKRPSKIRNRFYRKLLSKFSVV